MKGFVFTLDAIFSIVFAATAISALLFISYSGYMPPTLQSSEVSSLGSTLATATLQGVGSGSPLFGAGSSGSWPQYGADQGLSSGSAHGPTGPYLLFSFQAPANIIPAPVVSGGYVAFAAYNQIYELNATDGALTANYPVNSSSIISASPVFYGSALIYANSSGYLTSVSADNGNTVLWRSYVGYALITTPLQIEQGYVVFGGRDMGGSGVIYFIDPSNGTVVGRYQTTMGGGGPLVAWIANHRGAYYVGAYGGSAFDNILNHEYVNASPYPSNGFASYGNFTALDIGGAVTVYGNLSASYSKTSGTLNLTSLPYYNYEHRTSYQLPASVFNTTPSIGGNITYLLYNGTNFEAFAQKGQLFNVTLPGVPFHYNYSGIALAYGNAYLASGNGFYAFGAGQSLGANSSMLAALGQLYLEGRGGLADYILYGAYGAGNIGIFINGSYAPELHVSKFNGIDSYIAIPATPALSPEAGTDGAMSLCGWYKINSLSGYSGLLFKGTQSPSAGNVPEFTVDTGGTQGFSIYDGAGDTVASYSNSIFEGVGSWNSFCFTYNSSASYYYYNGTGFGASLDSSISPASGSGSIILGAGPGGYSNVSMANLQLYNVSLSSRRVSGIYQSGIYGEPSNRSGLVGWWPLLGDGNDYSGGGHVGIPSNSAFINGNYIPSGLGESVAVGSSTVPLLLTNNGVTSEYNVSVVIWSS